MQEVDILEIKEWLEELSKKIKTKLDVLQEIRLKMSVDIKLAEDIKNRWLLALTLEPGKFLISPEIYMMC
jgi:hypothetical protein